METYNLDIKKLRKDNNLSQQDLSNLTGIPKPRINQFEQRGKIPKVEDYNKLKDFFQNKNVFKKTNTNMGDVLNEEKETYIPLIPVEVMAGYFNGDVQVLESDIIDRYNIPDFKRSGVKFLIKVSGSSMYPKYSNGDILACRPINELQFVQWGKVYVMDTNQGPIVKRLFECTDDDKILECRSDNKEKYPPFKIPKKSIRKIALVVGVIRFE